MHSDALSEAMSITEVSLATPDRLRGVPLCRQLRTALLFVTFAQGQVKDIIQANVVDKHSILIL